MGSWITAATLGTAACLAGCSGSDDTAGAGAGSTGAGASSGAGAGSSGAGASGSGGSAASGSGSGGAAPGTWQHGATQSIAGSGFGTHPSYGRPGATTLARAWDNCESDDPLATWDQVVPDAAGEYGMRCRTPDEVSALKQAGAASDPAHSRATRYLTSGLWSPSPDANTWASSMTVYDTEVSPYFYASFYIRADPDWFADPDTDGNFKMYSYSIGNGAYEEAGFYYFGFAGFQDPNGGISMGPNYFTGPTLFSPCVSPGGDIRCVDPDLVNWYTPGCGGNGYDDQCGTIFPKVYDPVHPRSDWIKIEYLFKHGSSTDGVHDIYLDNVHSWHVELNDDAVGTGPATRSQTIGGYRRDYGSDEAFKNNWTYYNDVFVDLTWARVVAANSDTYATATVVEPQPPLSWSETEIEIQVNLGRLVSGEQAWVYVFDASGSMVGGQPVTSFTVP